MLTPMNRRHWLRAATLAAGGMAIAPSAFAKAATPATPAAPAFTNRGGDFAFDPRPELKARLFANENPFGPSEKAKQAIMEALTSSYQYPMRSGMELAGKIAAFEGVDDKMVMLSAGSSPILGTAAMYFAASGGNIVTGDPTYDDLPERAEAFKAKWVKVPLTADYKLDLDAMEKAVDANTKMVYICNPNNPTATVVDTQKLKGFCERVSKKVAVFVDEAYIDYLPDPKGSSMIDCVRKGQNIIVARTFSKLYGFAGLRVGYAIAHPDLVQKMEPYFTGTWCLTAPSIQAALASYNDRTFLDDALRKTNASREFLYKTLKGEGYDYIPSSANFVLFPIKMDGKRFTDEMMKRGVGVRYWAFNNKQWCRVSLGRMDEMEAFAAAFKEIS